MSTRSVCAVMALAAAAGLAAPVAAQGYRGYGYGHNYGYGGGYYGRYYGPAYAAPVFVAPPLYRAPLYPAPLYPAPIYPAPVYAPPTVVYPVPLPGPRRVVRRAAVHHVIAPPCVCASPFDGSLTQRPEPAAATPAVVTPGATPSASPTHDVFPPERFEKHSDASY